MAIAFDTFGAGGSTTSAASGTVDITAAAVGAVVFVTIQLGTTETSMTMTGWNAIETDVANTSYHGVYWRAKQSGDTTFGVSWSPTSTKHRWSWVSYTGVDTTTPYESWAAAVHGLSGSTTFATGSGTPTAADRWAAFCTYVRSTTTIFDTDVWSGQTIGGTGVTERTESSSTSGTNPWLSIQWADSAAAVAQSSQSGSATCDRSEVHGGGGILFLIPAGGTTHALAGTGASTSSATGDLTRVSPIAGTSASTSSATAAITLTSGPVTHTLTGTATSTSTATGALTLRQALSGNATSTSTGSGTLTTTDSLSGGGISTSTATATLTLRTTLTGTANSTSTAAGALNITAPYTPAYIGLDGGTTTTGLDGHTTSTGLDAATTTSATLS